MWLRDSRKKKKMTQADLASKAGISRPFLCEIERGMKDPSPAVAKRIAVVLGIEWVIFYNDACRESEQSVDASGRCAS